VNDQFTYVAPAAVGAGTYEDTDAAVSFTGSWTSFADPSNSGGSAKYSAQTGASIGLTYSGSAVTLVYLKQTNTGVATVTIDGVVVDQLDTYSATRLFQQQKKYTGAPGTHTVSLSVSGNKNAASGGGFLIFDAFMVGFNTSDYFDMFSQPGEYVGAGKQWVYPAGSATFSAQVVETGTAVTISVLPPNTFWYLTFAAPRGQPLVPGTYENAVRSAVRPNGVAGIDVVGDGRGCNVQAGRFVVDVVQFTIAGDLDSFHATFEQHCEGGTPALFGEVKFSRAATTVTFEDSDQHVTFNGNWTSFSDSNNSGGSAKYSSDLGATVSLDFSGTFVDVVYLKQANTGIATVSIDDAVVDQLDTYASSRQYRQTKTYLLTSSGTHHITVTVSGAKNPASAGSFVIFDAFVAEGP